MENDRLQQAAKQQVTPQPDQQAIPPKRDFVDKLGDHIEKAAKQAPNGESALWGAWRQGLKDLQNMVLNPFPQHIAQHEEPGTIANPTQMEVYDEKHTDGPAQPTLESQVKGTIEPPKEAWRGKLEPPAPEVTRERERG